jgi:hypothetical protein
MKPQNIARQTSRTHTEVLDACPQHLVVALRIWNGQGPAIGAHCVGSLPSLCGLELLRNEFNNAQSWADRVMKARSSNTR